MKKLILALIMVCLLAISVSAYRMSDNYSVNLSLVELYDSFTRNTTSWNLTSADTNQTWEYNTYGGGIDNVNHFQYVDGQTFVDYANDTWYGVVMTGYDMLPMTPLTNNTITFEWDYIDLNNGTPTAGEFASIDVNYLGTAYSIAYFFQNSNGSLACYSNLYGATDPTTFLFNDGNWHHFKLIATYNGGADSEYWAYMDDQLICNTNTSLWGDVVGTGNSGDVIFHLFLLGNSDAFNRTQLIDDLVGYSGNITPYYSTPPTWCYQEFANQSVCGEQKAGYVWYDDPPLFDGDWETYTNLGDTIGAVYYYRPEDATNDSQWQIKDGTGTYNLSLPNECWSASVLLLVSVNSGGQSDWSCLDDSWNFYPLYQSSSSGAENRYEEAMWWDVPEGSCEPDWVCNGYGYCLLNSTQPCISVTDNNTCGMSYSGDYSEFTPQPCIYGGCYQEFSTIGTDCGGVANPNNWTQGGAWDGGGGFQPADACVDGDWDSICCSYSASWVEENFTKPTGAYGAVWVTYGGEIVNNTIPQSCWDAYPDNLLVRDYSESAGGHFNCWNGTDWEVVRQWNMYSRCLREEGMYWAINCTPDWYCNGWESCINGTQGCNSTLDLNICGQAYQGNYSEFNPQSCGTPTGYVPTYDSGDLSKLTIDTFGQALLELLGLVGVVVVVVIVVVGAKGLKKVIK